MKLIEWVGSKSKVITIAVGLAFAVFTTIKKFYLKMPMPHYDMLAYSASFVVIAYLLSALGAMNRREKEMERIDALTGIPNRRAFYDLAGLEIHRNRRYKHPFTVAYLDIDNLKMVNYRLGYGTGDNLLQAVARTIKGNIREVDIVSRFGGDEFALLLPETGAESAQVVLSRLRTKLLEAMKNSQWPATFSFGAATFVTPPDSIEDVVKKAGTLMYSAKNSGPNMIDQEVFDSAR